MGWLKQLCLSWTILFVAAICVLGQELRSTLREGNHTCQGDEVIFTCTIRGPSSLSVLVLGWISDEYITGQGESLQLSTANVIGHVERSTDMDGSVTATATVTNNIDVNGELILESTLRITADEASTVTCRDPNQGQASIDFTFSAVPGVPQMINAREISRPLDNICIILVTWDPPANGDASDIDQYIIYVPSRNIRDVISSSSTLTTLTVPNCGDDIRIQVSAVNRVGCVGMNSSEVPPLLLDIPTASASNGNGSATSEGGSTAAEGGSSTSAIAAASVLAILFIILCIILVVVLVLFARQYKRGKKIQATEQVLPPDVFEEHVISETKLIDDLQKRVQDTSVKRNLEELYNALKLKLPSRNIQAAARDLRTTLILGMESSEFNEKVKEMIISYLEKVQLESAGEDIQRAIENMDNMVTGMMGIDEEFEEFKGSVRLLHTKMGTDEYKKVLDDLIKRVEEVQPGTITRVLLSLCEKIKLRNIRQVKDYYCKQSKYDVDKLGTEKDRVSVPIWIDDKLDDNWKSSLREAVKAINEAAPGLSLLVTKDKKAIIHVLRIDKEDSEPYTEVEGNILMQSKEKKFVTKVRLGKWKDDGKKGVCIHELFHALGFHHEHQDAIAAPYIVYHFNSGKQITIDKNELGFIQYESSSTTLYPCEKKCRGHSEGHVCKWVLEAYPTKVNTEFDEHDMVGLNLVYPPCVDKIANDIDAGYRPDPGKNGMYYCGREVMIGRTYPDQESTDVCGPDKEPNPDHQEYTRFCGPDKGPNCPACRTIKCPRVKEILKGGRWQGMTGRVYCGRPFTEPGILSKTHDGMCGLDNGPVCPDCFKILSQEESAK